MTLLPDIVPLPRPAWRLKFPVNDNAFSIITPESAYWAGFLMADGCVHYPKRSNVPKISLMLGIKDIGHIEKYKKFLGMINHKTKMSTSSGGRGKTPSEMCSVQVNSYQMAHDLAKLGIVPRKSKTAAAPAELINDVHFWRGCVDGDGSVSLRPYERGRRAATPALFLCGSETIVNQFADFCKRHTNTTASVFVSDKGVHYFKLEGLFAAKIITLLYQDVPVALDRKLKTAQEIIKMDYSDRKFNINGHLLPPQNNKGRWMTNDGGGGSVSGRSVTKL